MFRITGKILASVLSFIFFTFPVLAQDSHQDIVNDMAPDAGANIAKFNLDSINTFWSAAGCTVANQGCLGPDGEPVVSTSAVDSTAKYISTIIQTPPVNTATYVADVFQNFGVAQPVYAQGIGFSGLNPILKIWKAFRDISYFFFVVIFVVIGFMIMLRKKISNNAVVTIQQALPKVIITLLMITFSYAIAGLLIDLMYLSIFLITELFERFEIIQDASLTRNLLFGRNIITIGWNNFMGPSDVGGEASQAIGKLINETLGFGGRIANGLGYLIIAVAIFISLFRTLFALITAYVGIIIAVIFAPFRLLLNAIPGSDTFGPWLKSLLSNIIVFPVVAAMILIGVYLGGADNNGSNEIQIVDPNIIKTYNQTEPSFAPPFVVQRNGVGDATAVRSIIGLGFVLLLPEVVKMVKEALQVKEPAYGEAALKNAQAGYQKGPVAWVGGGAKWLGGVGTGALKEAGGTILSSKIMNSRIMKGVSQKSMLQQARRSAELADQTERYAQAHPELLRPITAYPTPTAPAAAASTAPGNLDPAATSPTQTIPTNNTSS